MLSVKLARNGGFSPVETCYKTPPKMGPWYSIEDATNALGLSGEAEFYNLVKRESLDIPHRYADAPTGEHDAEEYMISPLAMVSLFLLKGMYAQAREMISRMEDYKFAAMPC